MMTGSPALTESASIDVRSEPGVPEEGELKAFLRTVRRAVGADVVQVVRFVPDPSLEEECAPSSVVSDNLLKAAEQLPTLARGARNLINTYRFGGHLVHLIAAQCGEDRWLLAWVRLPEGASGDAPAATIEIAAEVLRNRDQVGKTLEADFLNRFDPAQPKSDRYQQFCEWFMRLSSSAEVFLARKSCLGWTVTSASRRVPTRSSPLRQAMNYVLKGKAEEGVVREIERLVGQASVKVFHFGNRFAVIAAGQAPVLDDADRQTTEKVLALLEGPGKYKSNVGAESSRQGRLWFLLSAGVLAVILSLPVHQRVRTEVILEPEVRRFVAAPFNAVVEKVHCKAGDVVDPGQLLIELDGREIAERLAEVRARLSMALLEQSKELDAANYTESTIRGLEAQGLAHERDLLLHRSENLRLYSPIHAVVVTGELERSEGAAVELGKPLLELAPLDALVAEMAVDESDISLVRPGLEAKVQMNARPNHPLNVEVAKIAPRATTREGGNVFVAEAELDNEGELLRPGMKGRAIIYADRRPLAWTLVRKPLQVVRRWLFR